MFDFRVKRTTRHGRDRPSRTLPASDRTADDCFAPPQLAAVYDALDPDRSDLGPYLRMVEAFAARRVLDTGCGTGVFARLLTGRGGSSSSWHDVHDLQEVRARGEDGAGGGRGRKTVGGRSRKRVVRGAPPAARRSSPRPRR
ncbi:hypothetical protein GCM10009535_08790 [Streptomyces thermocarboxydovorans]|uniref:Methyltransferase domain-containing protein n=1 Tax=Streptomyces thermocarboxydovorans TaxID=59298 RepID=A0ABN1HA39_9ACTN